MLKKLRVKFILINMTIVTIMLGVIFSLLYYSTSNNLKQETNRMMETIVSNPTKPSSIIKPDMGVNLPFFSVQINRFGEVTDAYSSYFDVSDVDELNTILTLTYNAKEEKGIIKDYNMRYLRKETPIGVRIVFVDMSSELSILRNLIKTFLFVGSAAFLVFLGISILLAKWAVKPVEEAWLQQKQFVADASHELKTPLTVIMTDVELLGAEDCPIEDRKPLTDSIRTMSVQMRGLVENLLDLARLDNGSVKEESTTISLSEVVTDTSMLFEPVFFEKGLSLRYEVEEDILVNGVSTQLKQLVSILLDNAGKYSSPEGETYVKLTNHTHKHALLEVANQGEAISDEDIKNIFKRFYKADKSRAMNHSYGLGLSIAQHITEQHHGKIWCESKDGYNHFYVEIPTINTIH